MGRSGTPVKARHRENGSSGRLEERSSCVECARTVPALPALQLHGSALAKKGQSEQRRTEAVDSKSGNRHVQNVA